MKYVYLVLTRRQFHPWEVVGRPLDSLRDATSAAQDAAAVPGTAACVVELPVVLEVPAKREGEPPS